MGWPTKELCPEHHQTIDPLYYRDHTGVFKRWVGKFLCRLPELPGHIVDIKDLPLYRPF